MLYHRLLSTVRAFCVTLRYWPRHNGWRNPVVAAWETAAHHFTADRSGAGKW